MSHVLGDVDLCGRGLTDCQRKALAGARAHSTDSHEQALTQASSGRVSSCVPNTGVGFYVPWLGNIKDITQNSSHEKDHIPIMVGWCEKWGHLMTHVIDLNSLCPTLRHHAEYLQFPANLKDPTISTGPTATELLLLLQAASPVPLKWQI